MEVDYKAANVMYRVNINADNHLTKCFPPKLTRSTVSSPITRYPAIEQLLSGARRCVDCDWSLPRSNRVVDALTASGKLTLNGSIGALLKVLYSLHIGQYVTVLCFHCGSLYLYLFIHAPYSLLYITSVNPGTDAFNIFDNRSTLSCYQNCCVRWFETSRQRRV